MTETHIYPTNNDSLLRSTTLAGFKLCHRHRPHAYSLGSGVPFFVDQNIQFKNHDSPTFTSFENTIIVTGSSARPFVIPCVYQPPGSCSDSFFDHFKIFLVPVLC